MVWEYLPLSKQRSSCGTQHGLQRTSGTKSVTPDCLRLPSLSCSWPWVLQLLFPYASILGVQLLLKLGQANPYIFTPYVLTLPSASLSPSSQIRLVFSLAKNTGLGWPGSLSLPKKLLSSLQNSGQLYHNKKYFLKIIISGQTSPLECLSSLPPSLLHTD